MTRKKEPKISAKEIRIEKINESHLEKIKGFQSYEKDLRDFLIDDALDNQEKNVSVTYLWFNRKTDQLLGYIALMTDSLALKKIDKELKEQLRLKGVAYPTLLAVKIGRVCVDDRFRRRGVGTLMLDFTISIIKKTNELIGCRFITLDAKENKDDEKNNSIHFYKQKGFKFLKEKNKLQPPMYYDIFKILKILNKE